jgi:hypothetical protein
LAASAVLTMNVRAAAARTRRITYTHARASLIFALTHGRRFRCFFALTPPRLPAAAACAGAALPLQDVQPRVRRSHGRHRVLGARRADIHGVEAG